MRQIFLFSLFLGIFVAVLLAQFSEDLIYFFTSNFPGPITMAVGKYSLDAWSLWILPAVKSLNLIQFEDCFIKLPSETAKVLIVSPKGGIVWGGKLVEIFIKTCGLAVGLSEVVTDDWPNFNSYPSSNKYDLQFIMGFGNDWQTYFDLPFNENKEKQCVVLTRNPYNRFVSLYSYTKDGAEYALKVFSAEMKKIISLEERVEFFWREMGQIVMKQSHPALVTALDMNCTQVFADSLFNGGNDYINEVKKLLHGFGVSPSVMNKLINLSLESDLSLKTSEQRADHRHTSGKSLEVGEKEKVHELARNHPIISQILNQQCLDLNFNNC